MEEKVDHTSFKQITIEDHDHIHLNILLIVRCIFDYIYSHSTLLKYNIFLIVYYKLGKIYKLERIFLSFNRIFNHLYMGRILIPMEHNVYFLDITNIYKLIGSTLEFIEDMVNMCFIFC